MSTEKNSVLIIAAKRSGTNFTHDVLASQFEAAVNEPLGLHNDTPGGKDNPLSPWKFSSAEHVSHEYGHSGLRDDPYGALLTKSFLGWLQEGGKLIKETDSLYLGWLLASAQLKIVSIYRDPRDSIASYKKHDLFEKWGFKGKLEQFRETIRTNPILADLYGNLPNEKTSERPQHQQLALYYAISINEIDRNIQGNDALQTTYDKLTQEPFPAFAEVFNFLGMPYTDEVKHAIEERINITRDPGAHGTFRAREDLTTFTEILSAKEEQDIRAICRDFGVLLKPSEAVTISRNSDIKLAKFEYESTPVLSVNRMHEITQAQDRTVEVKDKNPLFISETLVTNEQYAHFLEWLKSHNIPLSLHGRPMFYNDRPEGDIRRVGNEIRFDPKKADHPVAFVNWIGAAAYSAWLGGRLPTKEEWEKEICPNELKAYMQDNHVDPERANVGQVYSGSTSVTRFPANERGIYDALGNMSIWTHDKHDLSSYEKDKAGLEWNHTPERGIHPNPRPFWLGTSGLGIRTVFDQKSYGLSDEKYVARLREIIDVVGGETKKDAKDINAVMFKKFDDIFRYNKST